MGTPEFDLSVYEREQDRLDAEQSALEVRAQPEFLHRMKNLDSDVIAEALEFLSKNELRSLAEDLSFTDDYDLGHAGLMLHDCVERYVMRQAVEEVREYE